MASKQRRRPKLKTPPGLSREVAATWRKLVAVLGDRLEVEDADALEVFCRSVVLLKRALREAEDGKLVVKLHNKTTAPNQVLKSIPSLMKIVNDGYARFGLTPADREDLPTPAAPRPSQDAEDAAFERHLASRPPIVPIEGGRTGEAG